MVDGRRAGEMGWRGGAGLRYDVVGSELWTGGMLYHVCCRSKFPLDGKR